MQLNDIAPLVIAHIKEDEGIAARLQRGLSNRGLEAWCTSEVEVGESIQGELDRRIAAGAPVLIVATRQAVGTNWVLRLVQSMRSLDLRNSVFVAQMDKQAALDSLCMGERAADFTDSMEHGLDELCAVLRCRNLGRKNPVTDVDGLRRAFRDGNRERSEAYVGDKYRDDLYVERAAESQVRDFFGDPLLHAQRCGKLLARVLDAPPPGNALRKMLPRGRVYLPLTSAERRVLGRAMHACADGSVVGDPTLLEGVREILLPDGYDLLSGELNKYRAHLKSNVSSLMPDALRPHVERLVRLFMEKRAPREIGDTLRELLDPTNAPRQARAAREPSGPATTRLRKATRIVDRAERLLYDWSASRVLMVATSTHSGPGSIEFIDVGEVVRRCESTIDTAARRCLVIVDVAGSGKTNLISRLATRGCDELLVVALYARALPNERDPVLSELDGVAAGCGWSSFSELLAAHEPELQRLNENIVVMVDGLNEFRDDVVIASSVRAAVAQFKQRRVRFVVSCRDIYWQYFEASLTGPHYRMLAGKLTSYSEREFAEALKKYLAAYGLQHVRLEADAREKFRLPILLRFFCEAYGGRVADAPARVRHMNLKRLFDDYLKAKLQLLVDKGHSKTKYSGGRVTEAVTLEHMMLQLASAMRARGAPMLSRNVVKSTLGTEDLDSRASVFQLLRDEEIIIEERQGNVFFVYEAFMEYAIAKSVLTAVDTGEFAVKLDEMVREETTFKNMRGAVLMALVILAEDHHVDLMTHVLKRGSAWRRIVLEALAQTQSTCVGPDAVEALKMIFAEGDRTEVREAIVTMFTRCGRAGRRAAMDLLRSCGTLKLLNFAWAARSVSDARVIKDLVAGCAKGNSNAEVVLRNVSPNPRAVQYLIRRLDELLSAPSESRPRVVPLIVEMLSRSPPGYRARVESLLIRLRQHNDPDVVRKVKESLSAVQEGIRKSEVNRRRSIARSRRAGPRVRVPQEHSNGGGPMERRYEEEKTRTPAG
jgi:hypothetical protein